jgi:hypothetical protein
MTARQSGIILEPIRSLFNEGRIGTMTDEQLLQRFAARRADADQALKAAELAFEVLVLRHGPTVMGVCRRVLRDPHGVEDAFQATFLVLARRASSIRKPEVLGGWLVKVAYRVATRARALSARRAALEPTGKEAIFTLMSASRLRIRGAVTDAATGQSIEEFTVVPSVEPGGILMLDSVSTQHGGRYVFADAHNAQPYRIRIEAKGYLPVKSPVFPPTQGIRFSMPGSRSANGSRAWSAAATARRWPGLS